MSNKRHLPGWLMGTPNRPIALVGLVLGVAAGCTNESAPPGGGMDPGPQMDAGPSADGSGNNDAPTTPSDDGSSPPDGGTDGGTTTMPPFKSLEVAANAP